MQDFTEITREEILNKLADVYLNGSDVSIGIALETEKASRQFIKELKAKLSEHELSKKQKAFWNTSFLSNEMNHVRILARYSKQYFFAISPAYFVTNQKTLEKFPEAVDSVRNAQACMTKYENYLIKE